MRSTSKKPLKHRNPAVMAIFLVLLFAVTVQASDEVLLQAMKDELARSMQRLQLEKLEKPYFISYRIVETSNTTTSASFGSVLTAANPNRVRWLTVEVRVGDYSFDNTNFLGASSFLAPTLGGGFGGNFPLPLEDNYNAIRRQLWLATDAAYKKAVEDLAQKRASLQNKTRAEELPDFSRADPTTVTATMVAPPVNRQDAEELVRELSAAFREMPDIFSSRVDLRFSLRHTLYLNSEGATFVRDKPLVGLLISAETQADDGMPLSDSLAFYGRSISELPNKIEVLKAIRESGTHLARLRKAPLLERYNGPVLFEGQAAAAAFGQIFAPRLIATRRPLLERAQMETMAAQADNPFLDRLGGRVLPTSLSVTDNPTAIEYGNERLIGTNKVDDEGVPTRETRLVEKGYLRMLLATRVPVRGIASSTGSRHGSGPMPTNLLVSAEKGKTKEELKQELLRLVKERSNEYGIVIRRIANPMLKRDSMQFEFGFFGAGRPSDEMRNIVLAYKVYPDGREELIRNAIIAGITVQSFKEIVAASQAITVTSEPLPFRSVLPTFDVSAVDAASTPISLAVPSLLFEELTLKKPTGEIPKPPVAKHPFFDR